MPTKTCNTCRFGDLCLWRHAGTVCEEYEPKPKPWYVRLIEAIRAWANEG